jgi:hypothetical protein
MKAFLAAATRLPAVCALTSPPALAQPGSGGPGPANPPIDPTPVPLDGGVSLLLAGGIGYGIKQLRARHLARRTK